MENAIVKAVKAGAHVGFDTRWLRHDAINYVVMESQQQGRPAWIIYSGKDLNMAVAMLMSGDASDDDHSYDNDDPRNYED